MWLHRGITGEEREATVATGLQLRLVI